MIEMKCQACGAPLEKDGHCAYCGSRYKIKNDEIEPFIVQVERPGVHKVTAIAKIPYDYSALASDEEIGKMAEKQIAHKIAEQLGSCIKYTTRCGSAADLFERCVMVRGEIRVVDPSFRF